MHGKKSFFDQTLDTYKSLSAKALAAGKPDPGIPILTQSTLRMEQFINANSTNYTFPMNDGQVASGSSSVLPNEIRLFINDNFHIHRIGFYLAVTAASTDTAFRLMTNPNEIFLGSAAIALNYLNLWNGTMKINVNQVDVLTNWDTLKHMYVPQTQRLSATVDTNFDQIMFKDDGMIEMEPSLMISGAYTNTLTINLNAAVTSALASSNSRMVIVMRGLRAQNAAIRK
jgi:hypothetical protein